MHLLLQQQCQYNIFSLLGSVSLFSSERFASHVSNVIIDEKLTATLVLFEEGGGLEEEFKASYYLSYMHQCSRHRVKFYKNAVVVVKFFCY